MAADAVAGGLPPAGSRQSCGGRQDNSGIEEGVHASAMHTNRMLAKQVSHRTDPLTKQSHGSRRSLARGIAAQGLQLN